MRVCENPVFLPGAEDRPPYDPLGVARNKYPPCKFTYTDREGRILAQRYDSARDFSEGLAPVSRRQDMGFHRQVRHAGHSAEFDDAEAFHEGLAKISVKGLYGYADKSGAIVIPHSSKEADAFSDGLGTSRPIQEIGTGTSTTGGAAFKGGLLGRQHLLQGLAHVRLLGSDSASQKAGFAYIDTKGRRVFTY